MPSFQNIGGDAYKPGLERIEHFCESLGSPHLAYKTIHIAGTNGKGSTSHMMAAALQSAGYRVGLFTSPHLRDFRERMRVDGEMISEEDVVGFVAEHHALIEAVGLSFFEMTAAMAFDFFRRSSVDVAVIECGLGGRLDATNIVSPELSIITNIALDHTQYLGSTLAAIAAEKAGIIKQGRPVVLGEGGAEYTHVIEGRAEELSTPFILAQSCFEVVGVEEGRDLQQITLRRLSDSVQCCYGLDLQGEYQQKNIVTLLSAIECINNSRDIDLQINDDALRSALSSVVGRTHLQGRWQVLSREPLMVCDTGHNPHGLREVVRQIERQEYQQLYCVLGFASDKSLDDILPMFPRTAHFIFTQANIDRAYDADAVAAEAREMGLSCEVVRDVRSATAYARAKATAQDMIYIGGSTFVVAEVDLLRLNL